MHTDQRPLPETAGAFAELVESRLRAAANSGDLKPIGTQTQWLDANGCRFPVRVLQRLQHKVEAHREQRAKASAGQPANPFLPYEPAMYVCHIAPRHMVLLNKFPVLDDHLLIVTADERSQDELLDAGDFAALLRGLALVDGIGFYNGGPQAGASQRHKHLQLLPMTALGGELPIAPLLRGIEFEGNVGRSAALPFAHAATRIESDWLADPATGGAALASRYRALFAALGYVCDGPTRPAPYNLIATRELLWLVPRCSKRVGEFFFNALGYAGAMLVREPAQIEALRAIGPLNALAAGVPAHPETPAHED